MSLLQTRSLREPCKPNERGDHLSLEQIGLFFAQAALSQHQQLVKAHSGQVYVTDLDELVDFQAWKSVNANQSIETGVDQ